MKLLYGMDDKEETGIYGFPAIDGFCTYKNYQFVSLLTAYFSESFTGSSIVIQYDTINQFHVVNKPVTFVDLITEHTDLMSTIPINTGN